MSRSLALLGSRHPDALRISVHHLRLMGQAPFEPPSVKGWPVNEEWLNLRWLTARRRGLRALLANPGGVELPPAARPPGAQPHRHPSPHDRPAGAHEPRKPGTAVGRSRLATELMRLS